MSESTPPLTTQSPRRGAYSEEATTRGRPYRGRALPHLATDMGRTGSGAGIEIQVLFKFLIL